jgi:hypothetical protein
MATSEFNPRRCVVAGAFVSSNAAINPPSTSLLAILEPQARIALPSMPEIVPERVHRLVRVQRPDCVDSSLINDALEGSPALGLHKRVVGP